VPAEKAREYLQLMREVGLADYRSTEGNRGAWCIHRREGDVVHVEMFTFWENESAIRRFAGADMMKAKYYDFDAEFLLELEPEVTHFEVLD
jgi:heme-degrading monooxygenase HmoA